MKITRTWIGIITLVVGMVVGYMERFRPIEMFGLLVLLLCIWAYALPKTKE